MRYLSVCSGIEAASVAWHGLGWQPVEFCEIEPFPAAVLAHHYPDTPNWGDMTNFEEWPDATVDVLVGGTPCQAFSVAGLRGGLDDHRGSLTLTFIDIADRYDPEWIVWENVPGVLSSKDNAFGCFLAGLCGASEPFVPNRRWGKCGVVFGPKRTAAWRILDAQYFGVAQRRRRVFVVAVRGSRNWACAAALFPVAESMFWDSPPSRKTREGITCTPEGIAGNVSSKWSKGTGGPAGDEHYNLITHALRGEGFDASEDGTGRGTPLVPVAAYAIIAGAVRENPDGGHAGVCVRTDGVAYTLEARAEVQAVAQPYTLAIRGRGDSLSLEYRQDGTANALLTPSGGRAGVGVGAIAVHGTQDPCVSDQAFALGRNNGQENAIVQHMAVRRLTAEECEALQGFPRSYTNIPWRGKPESPDGPRYRAIGNSMAVPVMRWIGQRIARVAPQFSA